MHLRIQLSASVGRYGDVSGVGVLGLTGSEDVSRYAASSCYVRYEICHQDNIPLAQGV